jgi:hypothetical protein
VEGDMREGYGDTGHLPKGQPNQRQSRDRVSVVRYQPYSVTTPTSPASQNNNQEVRCSSSPVVPRGPAVVVTLPQTYAAPVRRRFHKGFSSSTTSCFTTKDVPTSATSTGHTSQSSRRSDLVSLNDILELPLTLPLRLRGGGSTQNMPVTSTTDDVPLSASTSVSAASSEHDVNQTNRESTTSSSSFDISQYQAFLASGGGAQQQHQVTVVPPTQSSSSTQSAQSSTHSGHVASGMTSNGGNFYQPVPLVMAHQPQQPGYIVSRMPGAPYQNPQHVDTHSRQPQQMARAYSVSDSATSSGTSYNEYQQGTNGQGDRGRGPKGKGKAVEDDESAGELTRFVAVAHDLIRLVSFQLFSVKMPRQRAKTIQPGQNVIEERHHPSLARQTTPLHTQQNLQHSS